MKAACMQSFGLRDYEAGIKKAGLRLLSFPIIEMAAPVCINATHTIIKQTAELLAQGHHIAVHCRWVTYAFLIFQNGFSAAGQPSLRCVALHCIVPQCCNQRRALPVPILHHCLTVLVLRKEYDWCKDCAAPLNSVMRQLPSTPKEGRRRG